MGQQNAPDRVPTKIYTCAKIGAGNYLFLEGLITRHVQTIKMVTGTIKGKIWA